MPEFTNEERADLIKRYPFLSMGCGEGDEYCWADYIPIGWWLAFGDKLCADLAEAIEKDGVQKTFSIYEIKEKYGMLEIYCNFSESVWNVVRRYESLSRDICINCGKKATIFKKNGWVVPLCDNCYEEACE